MGLLSADALAQHSACFVGCAVCNVLERQTHTPGMFRIDNCIMLLHLGVGRVAGGWIILCYACVIHVGVGKGLLWVQWHQIYLSCRTVKA